MARQRRKPKPPFDEGTALLMWAFIATEQCAQMHTALDEFSALGSDTPGDVLRDEEAFFRAFGTSVFLVSAANHVVALLDRDPLLGKLPLGVHDKIRTLRNVFEHWDAWSIDKSSAKTFRNTFPDAWPYHLRFSDGDLLIGGVLSFRDLEAALTSLYNWIRSPSSGRVHSPYTGGPVVDYPLEDP